jgi:hypothetical protein
VDTSLNSNTKYYWRVIAYDIFGSYTNSTQDFIYITDNIAPNITLDYPSNNTYVTSTSFNLNYTPKETNTIFNCTLFTNQSGAFSANQTNFTVIRNQTNNFAISLSDGTYLWNVLCYDLAGNNAYAKTNSTFKVDTHGPNINLMSPPNDTLELVTNNVLFFANASDAMSNLASCSLIIDNVVKQQSFNVSNDIPFNFTELVLNGEHNWSINCTDINGFESSSGIYNISVLVSDSDSPLIDMNYPSDLSFVSSDNISFNYIPKDATGLENCSIFIDGIFNQTEINPTNLVPSYFNVSGLSETMHTWQIQCYDNSSSHNFGVSAIVNFTVDLTDPQITLNISLNNTFVLGSVVSLNFTPNDTNLASCTLYGNFSGVFLANKTIFSHCILLMELIYGMFCVMIVLKDHHFHNQTLQ